MIQGLRQGVKDLSLFPVVCGSALSGLGTLMLLDTIVDLLPNPIECPPPLAENADGELEEFALSAGALPWMPAPRPLLCSKQAQGYGQRRHWLLYARRPAAARCA